MPRRCGHLFLSEEVLSWKEFSKVDERLKFVTRLLKGKEASVLCREFGTSRNAG